MNTLEDTLVAHLSEKRFEDLPAASVEAARRCLLDTLGVTVAGSSGDDIAKLMTWLQGLGGHAEATALVFGTRLPIMHAAWANGAMARAQELDDNHDATGDHTSVPILSAALATAEVVGGVSGRDLLAAYVLAGDLTARLRLGRTRTTGEGSFAANTFAPYSAAAITSLLLGLQGERLYDALGWAYAQCAGALQMQQSGQSTLHVHHGLAVATGVQAALLARQGLPGPRDFLSGKFGFYNAYEAGEYDPERIVEGLGERYEIEGVAIKQYPGGRVIHGPIDAAIALREEERLDPADIAEVIIPFTRGGFRMTCEPEAERRLPTVVQHAKFSLYYNVACALARGHVGLQDFTPQAIADETVRTLSAKIRVPIDPNLRTTRPGLVIVRLTDGRELRREVEHIKGSEGNPLRFEECVAKFRACLAFAARPLDPVKTEAAVALVAELETVDDVRQLVSLFA